MSTSNIARMLDWARYRFRDHEALVFEGERWTYWELDENVNALAAAIRENGINQGDRVGIIGTNVPNYIFLVLALSKIGAVSVTLNYRLHEEELVSQIQRSGAVGLVVETDFAQVGLNIANRVPQVTWRASLDREIEQGFSSITELIEAHRGERVTDQPLNGSELQRIVYTSGTTGLPKGAMLTHRNVEANMTAQVVELEITSSDRILVFAPLYHIGGLDVPGLTTFYAGATLVLMRKFDSLAILRIISEEKITGTCMVATMIHLIRDHPDRNKYDLNSVNWLIFSQVSQTLYRSTSALFPQARLVEGYGLTETCNGLAYLDADHMGSKLGSVGRPLHGVDLAIMDNDRFLGANQRGEVLARGDKVSPGYFDDEAATSKAFRNGWFHTGDIGYYDDDGYFYIVDRLKDMIRSGGENVASSEIERILYEISSVAEAAVVGMSHSKWVEVPVAVVVARPGQSIDIVELLAHCGSNLGKFKIPKAVFIYSELPRNTTGKVLKHELRAQLRIEDSVWVADEFVGHN